MASQTPHLYLRPEHNQAEFIRAFGRSGFFGAAVVRLDHLAPYPPGHSYEGRNQWELADALEEVNRNFVIDPFTPALSCAAVTKAKSARRLKALLEGQGVDLPLDPLRLANDSYRDAFVDAHIAFQARSRAIAAPYLEWRGMSDQRHEINLEMMRRAARTANASGRLAVGFVQMTRARLLRGGIGDLAAGVARAKVRRVFLRIRGLPYESATEGDLRAVFSAADALQSAGLEVVVDCVGRLGPVISVGTSAGFTTGCRLFRSIPMQPFRHLESDYGVSLGYEIPHRWSSIDWKNRKMVVGDCPIPGCSADNLAAPADAVRAHNLHYWRWVAYEGAKTPAWLISTLRAASYHGWADVLSERLEQAA